jgi:glycosyltransferase involved in cell wall biosynthesis
MTEKKEKVYKAPQSVYNPSPFARSRVDIIIPYHAEYERVTRLVEGIMYAVRSNPYRITLVDDGSPNSRFVEDLRKVDQDVLRVVRSEDRRGFGAALALGYQNTEQPWVMFMHSDVTIEDPDWMLRMGESLLALKDQGVKLISARTDNPGSGHDPRLKAARDQTDKDVVLAEGFVPLYCAMCHRDLFPHINGFVRPYPYAGYEDEELGWRMKYFGYKQAICGRAWVRHEGGVTLASLEKSGRNVGQITEENYQRCLADVRNLYASKAKKPTTANR